MTAFATGRDIVVGVDGSEASAAALRWAAEQARAVHAEVVAVHAWEPTGPHIAPYAPVSARPTAEAERDAAARLLADTVRSALGSRKSPGIRAELVEGPAARVLLDRARGALLLALGHTLHGPGDQGAIGAVGRECLRHAMVPVVEVPATGRPTGPARGSRTRQIACAAV
ncbi:universal stress protein [Streptomyces sp. NPDC014864]|uniref:universal stress protein n=1 Tax=Streptomyces sp. NPDC014864 TaxID=3364924 RepID=UPI0036FD1F2D